MLLLGRRGCQVEKQLVAMGDLPSDFSLPIDCPTKPNAPQQGSQAAVSALRQAAQNGSVAGAL
ncbi:hypothetical protein [Microvirga vignae]|uniref:hypothetical protein n=1 Tax=Microvirga vignae TaxID=1225564 RepID=UPI000AAC2776|nr:hypothetical protein [Microvirga vignae]